MRCLMMVNSEIYEFIYKDTPKCPAVCDAFRTELCGKYAEGKSNNALCYQLLGGGQEKGYWERRFKQ